MPLRTAALALAGFVAKGAAEANVSALDADGCRELRPWACGEGLRGTLLVNCKSANNLHNGDESNIWWTRHSDPFCRVSLVDKTQTEVSYEFFRNRYHDYKVVGEVSGQTDVIFEEHRPVWIDGSLFRMNLDLAQGPPVGKYLVEVVIEDLDWTTSTEFLGAVYQPLENVEYLGIDRAELEYPLSHNAADSSDKRQGKGTVMLGLKWCAQGDKYDECIQKGVADMGYPKSMPRKSSATWSGEPGCISLSASGVESLLQGVEAPARGARSAAKEADAPAAVRVQQQWGELRRSLRIVRRELAKSAADSCGKAMATATHAHSEPLDMPLGAEYSEGEAEAVLAAAATVRQKLTHLRTCLSSQWKSNHSLDRSVCKDALPVIAV